MSDKCTHDGCPNPPIMGVLCAEHLAKRVDAPPPANRPAPRPLDLMCAFAGCHADSMTGGTWCVQHDGDLATRRPVFPCVIDGCADPRTNGTMLCVGHRTTKAAEQAKAAEYEPPAITKTEPMCATVNCTRPSLPAGGWGPMVCRECWQDIASDINPNGSYGPRPDADAPPPMIPDREIANPTPAFRGQVGGHHYSMMPIQPAQYNLANGLGWVEGDVVAYVSRWKQKGGIEDLRKARHMLDMLIEHITKEAAE